MIFKSEILFVRILLPFLVGIYTAYLVAGKGLILPFLVITGLLFFYLALTNFYYQKLRAYKFKGFNGAVVFLFFFATGGLICLLHNQSLKEDYYAHQQYNYLKVWVNDEPQLTDGILKLQTEVVTAYDYGKRPKQASGKLLIAIKLDSLQPISITYGDELLISAEYLPVEPAYNPGEFNFKAWLAAKNIYQQTFITQSHLVKLKTVNGNAVVKHAIILRKKQVATYRKLIKNDEAFAIASTLVLGYRVDLSKDTLATYSKTGTIHALSVSGAHVAIIFLLLNSLLSFLDRKRILKLLKFSLICALVWYYALLTGFSPSVLRSAIMITVFMISKALNRPSNNYNILAFTAFCLLIYHPFLIWDVGFQLSFISVFGLIYLQPKIYNWIYIKNKWLDKLWSAVALSLAAQLVTFPLSVYYFHQFPTYFIFGNLFILLPLITIMYLGIAILVTKAYFLAPFFEWLINFTNIGLKWVADLPFAGITAIWLNEWQLIVLSLSLCLIVFALANYHKKILFIAIGLLIIYQCLTANDKLKALTQSKILCFSLSKNYAAAFIDSKKAVLLTDLKLSDNAYLYFVKPALDQLQVKQVVFTSWQQDTVISYYIKKENQLIFHGYQILMVDETFNYKKIKGLPKVNAIWIHHHPRKPLLDLSKEVSYSTLLIDATNKDYQIKKYEEEAKKVKLKYYTLKKNKAYLINLK